MLMEELSLILRFPIYFNDFCGIILWNNSIYELEQ